MCLSISWLACRSVRPPSCSHVDKSLTLSNISDLSQIRMRMSGLTCRQLINLVNEELLSTLPQQCSLLLIQRVQLRLTSASSSVVQPLLAADPLVQPGLPAPPLDPSALFGSSPGCAAFGAGCSPPSETFQVSVPRATRTSSFLTVYK